MERKKKDFKNRIRILFFIGSLGVGGKERRLVELLSFLKKETKYELLLITTQTGIEFPKFFELDVQMKVLKKNSFIYKFNYFFQFYQIIKDFSPDIIHTWGRMQTLYSIPAAVLTKTKLVNGQITSAPPKVSVIDKLADKINFHYSDVILSNSKAGIESFRPPVEKSRVIYNGLDMNRFENLPDISMVKDKYKIETKYLVIMIANFTSNKDYEKFFRIGNLLTMVQDDITCMGVGHFEQDSVIISRCKDIIGTNNKLIIHPKIIEVEALVNASDVGLLFSPNGEGISNAIIEYMALGKAVVANDAGGTKEVISNNQNGYLIRNESDEDIRDLVLSLINNIDVRLSFGKESRKRIEKDFNLDVMGNAFMEIYNEVLLDR